MKSLLDSVAQKHRGFAFVTYTSTSDAQDAIDNMDLNELRGRVLRVNLARPQKLTAATSGYKASGFLFLRINIPRSDPFRSMGVGGVA